jgi:hypothetical protein
MTPLLCIVTIVVHEINGMTKRVSLVEKPEGKDNLEDLGVDGRIITIP